MFLKEVAARFHQVFDGVDARGGSSVAEHQPSKLVVAGSNPVPRFTRRSKGATGCRRIPGRKEKGWMRESVEIRLEELTAQTEIY